MQMTKPDGTVLVYLRRRFVPQPEKLSLLQEHSWSEGDRLDNLAAQYIGDPTQYWRICDANGAMRPDELTETIGRMSPYNIAGRHSGGKMMAKGIHMTLMIGPIYPSRRRLL